MFCAKCGTKVADEQKFCPSCGSPLSNAAASGGGASVVVVKEKGGCAKGCLIVVIAAVVIGFALVMIIGGTASKEEKQALAESSAVTAEEASKNGEELIAWIRNKRNMTDIQRDDAFAKIKGKTVIFNGTVNDVGKTAFSDEPYVSLTVGKIDALERINIQFNVRKSYAEKIFAWNKGEIHTMRGRIKSQGDIQDDAECDMAEVVPEKHNAVRNDLSNGTVPDSAVPVLKDADSNDVSTKEAQIKAALKAWQGKRWKGDVIASARKERGKVSIADLTEKCETEELQPIMDILVADYVTLVNSLDAYVDATNAEEALAKFTSALSLSDIAKILEDSAKIVQTLNELRNGTSTFDFAKIKALSSDAITIGKVTLSIGDVCGLSKDILSIVLRDSGGNAKVNANITRACASLYICVDNRLC